MDMSKELFNAVQESGSAGSSVQQLRDTETRHVYVVKDSEGARVHHELREPVDIWASLDDIDSFVSYVENQRGSGNTIATFVGRDRVQCDMAYGTRLGNVARMGLGQHPNGDGINALCDGVSHEYLNRLLLTDLYGCFPAEITDIISKFKVAEINESNLSVNEVGLKDGSKKTSYVFTAQAEPNVKPKEVELPLLWTFTGRYFNCVDETMQADFRLLLRKSGDQYEFKLFPVDGNDFFRVAREQVQALLQEHESMGPVYLSE